MLTNQMGSAELLTCRQTGCFLSMSCPAFVAMGFCLLILLVFLLCLWCLSSFHTYPFMTHLPFFQLSEIIFCPIGRKDFHILLTCFLKRVATSTWLQRMITGRGLKLWDTFLSLSVKHMMWVPFRFFHLHVYDHGPLPFRRHSHLSIELLILPFKTVARTILELGKRIRNLFGSYEDWGRGALEIAFEERAESLYVLILTPLARV